MIKKHIFAISIGLFIILTAMKSIPQDKKIPDFSLVERKDVPEEYKWKIDDIYSNIAEWEADKDYVNNLILKIDGLSKDWTSSPSKMIELLNLLTDINIKGGKLYSYSSHQANTDLSNVQYQKMEGEIQTMFVNLNSKLSFMNPDILALGPVKLEEYINQEPNLAPYKFNLLDVIRKKEHILPDEQQSIVSLTGLFSGAVGRAASMFNDVELPPIEITLNNNDKITLNYANYIKYRGSKERDDRTLVMREFWKNQKKYENTLAILQDGAVKQHLFNSRVKKFNSCLESRLFSDNIPEKVYHQLIKMVRNNLSPMHRYLQLKKRLLKLEQYRYEDIYASAVPSVEKSYSYEEAKDLVIESMKPLGKDYIEALQLAFNNRWIDIYPNKGKESGAYSGGLFSVHPFIKMNYNGEYDAVSTLTHELGHAMHSYYSDKTQHYSTSDYPTFLAEIASTFNENMLVNYMLKNEKDDLFKLFLIDSYLDQVRGTLYRQSLFAEFELAMHEKIQEGKTLTSDWLNEKYLALTREYYGHDKGVCTVDDYIQIEWSRIPHFYYNFYVFQYSTGIIASLALSDMILNGSDEQKQKYIELLKSGGSDYPIEILKIAGVDMTEENPYIAAFKRFDELVTEMEKILEKLGK